MLSRCSFASHLLGMSVLYTKWNLGHVILSSFGVTCSRLCFRFMIMYATYFTQLHKRQNITSAVMTSLTESLETNLTSLKNILWDVPSCSLVELHRRFGRKYDYS